MDYLKEFETNLAYHFSEVLEYLFARPYWVYVSLSHKCTYNCQMCGVVKILKGYELPRETLEKALDEIAGWDWDCSVILTGGEPFLRADIFELIDYAVRRGIPVESVSNGSLIDKELAHKIISSGLENIAISLDGAKEATHDSIRQKGSFSQAMNAIRNLVLAKEELGRGPQISVWTTIMKENVTELYDIIPLARGLGIDCLVYHPVVVAQDDMQNTSPDAPFWIRQDNLKLLKGQIDKICDYQDKNGLVAFLHDPYLWVKHFEGALTRQDWKCNPFVFINIGPDGEVRSCGSSFGNIGKRSLDDCLHTKEAHKARCLMKKCQKPCLQTCWAHPVSDSPIFIADALIKRLKEDKVGTEKKREIIEKAIAALERYEDIAK